MAVPTIQRIFLSGATLTVTWYTAEKPPADQYKVKVLYGADSVFTTAIFPGKPTSAAAARRLTAALSPALETGELKLPGGALDTNVSYFVQVSTLKGNSEHESSQKVPLITRPPVLRTGHFDGTDFIFEWEPSPQAGQGYFLQLYDRKKIPHPPYTGTAPAASSWGKIEIEDFPLSTGQWSAQVAAVGTVASDNVDSSHAVDHVYAANAGTPLPAAQPSSLTFTPLFQRDATGSFITAQWTALKDSSGVKRYRLQSYGPSGTPGAFADVPGVNSTSGTLPLLADFAPGSTLRLLALNEAGVGVSTPAMPVLTTMPALTAVAFSSDNKAVDVAWRADGNAAVTGFTVEIYDLADPSQSYTQAVSDEKIRSVAFTGLPKHGLAPTHTWAIRVLATGAAGSVPAAGESWPLPAAAPTLTALACQESELNVSWSLSDNAARPSAFVVSLTSGDKTVNTSLRVEGAQTTQARLWVPEHAARDCSVAVAAVGPGDAHGPFSASVTPLATKVTGVTAVTDAIGGKCTLSWAWTGARKPDSYRLDFSDGTSVTEKGTTHVFAAPLPAGADLSVCITPLDGTSGQAISGPATAPHRLPTLRAIVVDATFDAAAMTVSATWAPLPGATGYSVALVASKDGQLTRINAQPAEAPADATRFSVAFPSGYKLDSATQYLVLVQGRWRDDLGMQGNQPPIFESGFFMSTSAATTAPPFVYPATRVTTATSANSAMTGEPLALYLPQTAPPLKGLPVTQGAFTLAANSDAARNKATYPYVLTISNTAKTNNPWAFGPGQAMRSGLAGDVRTFLENVEKAGAAPWAIALIQQIVARAMPQTFAEQLYYNFGLTFPGAGVPQASVDLRPGMVLRVVPNPYQTVPQPQGSSQGSWLSGYAGAACIDYDVGSLVSANGAWSTGFDTFIGQLVGNGALHVDPPMATDSGQEMGVAEAADLYFPAFTQPFYRLFVPLKLLSPTGLGSLQASANFVLAAAPSYTSLSTATSAPTAGNTVTYFRGRAVLKACLRVMLNGVGLVVPVGTTLANLLEQSGRLAPPVAPPLLGVRIERGLGGAVLDPNAPSRPAGMAVHLDWQAAHGAVYGAGWGVASMPLLPGDRIALE